LNFTPLEKQLIRIAIGMQRERVKESLNYVKKHEVQALSIKNNQIREFDVILEKIEGVHNE
jgi:hypothetical protein